MTVRRRLWAILVLLLGIQSLPIKPVLGDALSQKAPNGDPENGREVFHGKGICYYCHGRNGDPEHLPELEPATLRTIRGLRQELKLKSDSQRFLIIRDGHEGTGMLPDITLSNQEIWDVVAYVATLRAGDKQRSK